MSHQLPTGAYCAGFFSTVPAAEKAVTGLLAGDFSHDQLGIIIPEQFRAHFPAAGIHEEKPPVEFSPLRIAEGAGFGAAIGGVTLAAAALATGGAALVPGAMVLLGGGALVGGISGAIVSDGYRGGMEEYFAQAQDKKQIVVGVHLDGEPKERYFEACSILRDAGAESLVPKDDPTL